ncbi:S-layer domain protein, partial [mine drainage metagenome]
TTPFSDVPAGAWYTPYVVAALRAGLVQGVSANTFAPGAPLTREELAVMLARALHLTHTVSLTFTDRGTIGAWALPSVQEVVAAGYMQGFADGRFEPAATATRAQVATVLAKVLTADTVLPAQ